MPHRQFVEFEVYQQRRKKLSDALEGLPKDLSQGEAVDRALDAYARFAEITDQHFPMLLSAGDAITLPRAPSALYLLPPVDGVEDWRAVVCQFRKTPDSPGALALYRWQLSKDTSKAELLPLAGQDALPTSAREGCDLGDRPREIVPLSLSSAMLVFRLDLPAGSLTVSAIPDGPPASMSWQPKDNKQLPQAERISTGEMPVGLRFRRRTDPNRETNWPDDEVLLPDGNALDPQENIGRINGLDGLSDTGPYYLASNHGKVLRVDVSPETATSSKPLGGQIDDVLVLPHPVDPSRPVILAPCYDGKVYWLKDEGNRLVVKHWQNSERLHIRRITGTPCGNVLAMDQYQRLWPLRLNDVDAHDDLRKRALLRLIETLGAVTDEELARPSDPGRSTRQLLLLTAWLHELMHGGKNLGRLTKQLMGLVTCLKKDLSADPASEAAMCFDRLLKRSWRALRDWDLITIDRDNTSAPPPTLTTKELGLIEELLHLPDPAPDWLWLKLFRDWDLLEPWGQSQKWERPEDFDKAVNKLRERIYRKRLELGRHGQALRPASVYVSHRLPGQAKHIRALHDNGHRFVCVAYAHGLFLFDLREVDAVPQFHQVIPITISLSGQIHAIATGITGTDNAEDDWVFLATQRGECRLLRIRKSSFIQVSAHVDIPLDCATAIFADFTTGSGHRRGFLVGGSHPDERAALGWVELDRNNRFLPYQEIYHSGKRGRIRVLARGEGEEGKDLWGIDQITGVLRHWSLEPLYVNRKPHWSKVSSQIWYQAASGLHALYATTLAPIPQIICAGHDGMAVSLDRRPEFRGRLVWSTGCSATIRRLRRVSAPNGTQGAFLLAGDSEHLLIHDDQGRLTGMLEEVGPISALGALGPIDQRIMLIGARSGRLMGLSLKLPDPDKPDQDLPRDSSAYPLRQPLAVSPLAGEDAIVERLRRDEPLLFQDGLRLWWPVMDEDQSESPGKDRLKRIEQAIRLKGFPEKGDTGEGYTDMMAHRSALALRRPHLLFDGQPVWPKKAPALLDWVDTHWDALRERSPGDMLCQVVDATLAVLEPLAREGDMGAKARVCDWSSCIWADHSQDQNTCPEPLYLLARLRLMRLNQGARAWQAAAAGEKGAKILTPAWVDRLIQLWDIATPEERWRRFQWFTASRFPFSGEVLDDPFMAYLRKPDDPEAIDRLGLRPLLKWMPEQIWSEQDLERLREQFPENEHWKGWIDRFQELLIAARDQRLRIPHLAWREEKSLNGLRDHLTATADEQLTAFHGLAFAGLFWGQQAGRWLQAIAQRQNDLHDLAIQDEPGHYLEVNPHYHWENRNSVRVRLGLEFRGTRVLVVERAYFQPEGNIITTAAANTPIPADGREHEYSFVLKATHDDVLDQVLSLNCQDFRGSPFQRLVHLDDRRGLEGFRSELTWQAQARALMGWLDRRAPLVWLCGPDWPQAEHERLKALVRERYPEGWRVVRAVDHLDAVGSGPEPIFVAGFSAPAGHEVEAVHALLHQHNRGALEPWALGFWLEARTAQNGAQFRKALARLLPAPGAVRSLGQRLLGEKGWGALVQVLRELPAQSLAAWACGGALDNQTTPQIGDLGLKAWQELLKSGLSDPDMVQWLDVQISDIKGMRRSVRDTQALIAGAKTGGSNAKSLVQPLVAALWPAARVGIHKDVPFIAAPQELMYHHMELTYLLPPGLNPVPGITRKDEGLWLSIEHPAPPGLPGVTLNLNADAVLALLASTGPGMARHRLNEIAGGQLRPEPDLVFQTAHGISEERMANAFHGRERERQSLLSLALSPDGRSILLVGGRRSGKTSLLDRLRYDLKQAGTDRCWASCLFLDPPYQGDTERDTPLLRWFLRHLRDEFDAQGKVIPYRWTDTKNRGEREEALASFARRLADIKRGSGPPILLLDETSGLLRADAPNDHIGRLLREWGQMGLITLIATAYPHGSRDHPSLHKRIDEGGYDNPWHNFFTEGRLELKPWSPQETWEFLQPRLAGFGITLPRTFEASALELCRGVPWITQELGLALCKAHPQQRQQITQGEWGLVQMQVTLAVQAQIKGIVLDMAALLDRMASTGPGPSPKGVFGPGRLWNALSEQASGIRLQTVSAKADAWPESHALDLERLKDRLDGIPEPRLTDALVRLCEAGLLVGEEENTRFTFWNDLVPAVLAKT